MSLYIIFFFYFLNGEKVVDSALKSYSNLIKLYLKAPIPNGKLFYIDNVKLLQCNNILVFSLKCNSF